MACRKRFRTFLKDKEDKSSDAGSIRDGTDCSEGSSITFYERKMKKSSQKYSISIKNAKKSETTHLSQETLKNLNSSPPHTLAKLPSSGKESNRNRNNITMKSTNCIRAKKKIVPRKRTALSSYHKTDTHTQELKGKTPFSKSRMKSNKQALSKCISLTDIRNKEKDESVLPSLPPEDIFSLKPSRSEDFEKGIKSNGKSDYYDYMKEFDLIRNSSLLNQWGKTLWPSQKEALIPLSKLSSSRPFVLKRKTYSCGILSINDPEVPSAENDTSGVKESLAEPLKCGTDESDVCYLTENSDLFDYDYNSGSEVSENKNILDTSTSSLNIKQPIRVKYVDESTVQDKELLIYSNDFFENLCKEKGKSKSNIEVFENILEQSTIYEGNKLRVIPDVKEYFRSLRRNNKHQKDTKNSQVSKHDPQEASKKKVMQSQRKIQSTPCWRESHSNAEVTNERKDKILPSDSFVKVRSQKSCKKRNVNGRYSSDGQIFETKKCFSPKDIILNSRNESKELKDINIKIGDDLSEIGGCNKSRTVLKRINTEEVIASNFRHYFHFYAKLGGRLKSGVVISKMNSHFWLKKSGIIYDDESFTIADDCFNTVAKRKLVLNISDYMQYLSAIAKRHRLLFMDVVKRLMMNIDLQTGIKMPRDLESNELASEPQLISKSQKSTQHGKINNNFAKPPQEKGFTKYS